VFIYHRNRWLLLGVGGVRNRLDVVALCVRSVIILVVIAADWQIILSILVFLQIVIGVSINSRRKFVFTQHRRLVIGRQHVFSIRIWQSVSVLILDRHSVLSTTIRLWSCNACNLSCFVWVRHSSLALADWQGVNLAIRIAREGGGGNWNTCLFDFTVLIICQTSLFGCEWKNSIRTNRSLRNMNAN